MQPARPADKEIIVDILTNSFRDNKSVNYIIKQDNKSLYRIRKLMEYCFDLCFLNGTIILSDDKKGCALLLCPYKSSPSLKAIMLDVKLVFYSIGIMNIKKVLKREARVKAFHPREPFIHLWFIGVQPGEQNKGIGTALLNHVLKENIPVYLETSTLKNLPWYTNNGFKIYGELELGYTLYLLRQLKR